MDKKLKKLMDQDTKQRRLNKKSDEREKKEQARVSGKEKELLPRKLEMAEDIFRWGRDILANEDYKFVRELGVSDGLALLGRRLPFQETTRISSLVQTDPHR